MLDNQRINKNHQSVQNHSDQHQDHDTDKEKAEKAQ
jgi:hypothetical protein